MERYSFIQLPVHTVFKYYFVSHVVTPPQLTGSSHIFRFRTTKEKFHGVVDAEWQSLKGEKASENEKVEEANETSVEEPDAKKLKLEPEERSKAGKPGGKRLRGQNKSRPHIKPTTYDEKRLCLSVIQVRKCN